MLAIPKKTLTSLSSSPILYLCLAVGILSINIFRIIYYTPSGDTELIPARIYLSSEKTQHSYKQKINPEGNPQNLIISKINLNSAVEIVGQDPDGKMSVPAEGQSVSWYKHGVKPGEIGNAVIAGHYDVGANPIPAIFYRLKEVQIGDEINILDDAGKTLTFNVYDIQIVPENQFPLEKVYGSNNIRALNLITCHGKYDPSIKTYNQRLIVYSRLAD